MRPQPRCDCACVGPLVEDLTVSSFAEEISKLLTPDVPPDVVADPDAVAAGMLDAVYSLWVCKNGHFNTTKVEKQKVPAPEAQKFYLQRYRGETPEIGSVGAFVGPGPASDLRWMADLLLQVQTGWRKGTTGYLTIRTPKPCLVLMRKEAREQQQQDFVQRCRRWVQARKDIGLWKDENDCKETPPPTLRLDGWSPTSTAKEVPFWERHVTLIRTTADTVSFCINKTEKLNYLPFAVKDMQEGARLTLAWTGRWSTAIFHLTEADIQRYRGTT